MSVRLFFALPEASDDEIVVPINQSCCSPGDVNEALEGHLSAWHRRDINVTLGNSSFMGYALAVVYLIACFLLALVVAVITEDANYWLLANLGWFTFFVGILVRYFNFSDWAKRYSKERMPVRLVQGAGRYQEALAFRPLSAQAPRAVGDPNEEP
ncbi:unnamed protein product [Symbiodinium microadriaticum]|nr:unnamed protein product [Symbiodinium microadriaticum]